MILLDSDIVIWILRDNQEVIRAVSNSASDSFSVSSLAVAEVYKNVRDSELKKTEEFFDRVVVISVSRKIGEVGGLYWNQFHKTLANLSIVDCLIAATAKEERSTLFTLNSKHFPMRDIKVVNPLD